ncbi:uncharacterized protein LOC115241984 [Formica exsecta]|uniref:uncharacterized protein LOC115241984 n=1 Tax=Formica exsecta TaxID=72781 RepID=UPI001143BC50|nr:uncharacterized protein LOC115241984 [Formica exsecta]
MISKFVDKDHRDWDEHLPAFQFAFNTAVHDATGYTPAYITHGRELVPPHRTAPATKTVRIKLARAFQRQERYYNLRRREWRPRVGEWVWKRDHPLSKKADNFNAKLAPKYIGPLEVRRIVSPVIVDLRSKRGKWYRHVHIQDFKVAKTKHDGDNNNPEDEADDTPTTGGEE